MIATALYSLLFYNQTAGINFALFNLALIFLLAVRNKNVLKDQKWQLAALGCLCSAFCIGWYGNELSVIANIISLSLLSGLSINVQSSVFFTLAFSFYSYLVAPIMMFLDWMKRNKQNSVSNSNSYLRKVWLVVLPIMVTLLFFLLYRSSDLLFDDLVKSLKIDFISGDWILFTIGGFILMYGFFYHRKISYFAKLDENASDTILPNQNSGLKMFGIELSTEEENFSGKVLFLLLNVLLLIVNVLNVSYLFLGRKLPPGITYSDFVHQGTSTLIASILIAIALILFYFRGSLNHFDKSGALKCLAYLWILQNLFMLTSTWLRNDMYIVEYGLTYKRIGVYSYLLLAGIGLITTCFKIMKMKSNAYLFRINGWLFYGVLILSAFFSWNAIIYSNNVHKAKQLDLNYLLDLSDSNLPDLFLLAQDTSIHQKLKPIDLRKENQILYQNDFIQEQGFYTKLSRKFYNFQLDWKNQSCLSWSYENMKIQDRLIDLNALNKLTELELQGSGLESLEPLKHFSNISQLNLSSNRIQKINEVLYFKNLKRLDISSNLFVSVDGIEVLKNLEYLNLACNDIIDYSPLYNLLELKELIVSETISDLQFNELGSKLSNTRIIKD